MKDSKLFELFKSLSKVEINRFKDFVQSPYMNKNEKTVQLFDCFYKALPKLDSLNKETIFNKIFLNEPYNDLKIRHLMSLLLKLAEDFLILERNKTMLFSKQLVLMDELRKRKLIKHYGSTIRNAENEQKKQHYIAEDYYYKKFLLEKQKELYESLIKERRTNTNYQELSDALDEFYFASKLRTLCDISSHQNLFNKTYNIQMTESVLAQLDKKPPQSPYTRIYLAAYQTLNKTSKENFNELKKLLNQYENQLPSEELKELFAIARNYSIRQLNSGNPDYYREVFDLYKISLNKGFLLDRKNFLTPSIYKNIVAIGLHIKEFEWVNNFIEEYALQMEKNYRIHYKNYAMGKWHFAKGNYHEVIGYLFNINYSDIFMMLDTKVTLLKTYYELGNIEVMESLLESFKQLLNRKKVLGYHKEAYQNILKFARQLVYLNHADKGKKAKLILEIKDTKPLPEKSWLLEKLA